MPQMHHRIIGNGQHDRPRYLAKAVPGIVKSVVEATVKAKDFKKTFAEIATGKADRMEKKVEKTVEKTMHTAIKENQQALLKKASQQQDADHYERNRRKRNVVVKNMRESTQKTSKLRYDSDIQMLEEVLEVDKREIITCYRAGVKRENGVPRLLIVTLSTPDLAEQLHNYGSGTRLENSGGNKDIWINQDLIKSDRDANYQARKIMRERRAALGNKRQAAEKKSSEESNIQKTDTQKNIAEKPVAGADEKELNEETKEAEETSEVKPDNTIDEVSDNENKFL